MKIVLLFLLTATPVSKYLTYKEVVKTAHVGACANVPSKEQLATIRRFGFESFDKLRVKAGTPLYVSSLYRSECINRLVGGAKNSEHLVRGNVVAVDIDNDGKNAISNRDLFFLIDGKEIKFRKKIWEFGSPPKKINPALKHSKTNTRGTPAWTHYSYSTDPAENIGIAYIAVRVNGLTKYIRWLD